MKISLKNTVIRFNSKLSLLSCFIFSLLLIAFIISTNGCKTKDKINHMESFRNSLGMTMLKFSSYYVSKYETTQKEFEVIMNYNPSSYKSPNNPVEHLSGKEALEFCKKLTQHEKENATLPEGYYYTLPTFEQWLEYTGGVDLKGSVTPDGMQGRHLESHLPVGSGEKNQYGLYDLRGNVSEYSLDFYNTSSHMILGASWNTHRKDFLRLKNQAGFFSPDDKSFDVGFRCVLLKRNMEE